MTGVYDEVYRAALDRVCKAAGPGGPDWNRRFLAALAAEGLALTTQKQNVCTSFSLNAPFLAPIPYPDPDVALSWSNDSFVVWAIDLVAS